MLGAAVVIGRALLRQDAAPAVLYGFFGLTLLLAIAYLVCVFCIRNNPTAQGGEKNMENKNKKKQSGKGVGLAIGVLILFLSGLSEGFDSEVIGALVVVAVVGAVMWICYKAVNVSRGTAARQNAGVGTTAQHMKRHEPKVEIHRAFPEPEAHCVVCDNTGVDHFERDRQMRLQQLDDWLKNGLIEREEYMILKHKYEQS